MSDRKYPVDRPSDGNDPRFTIGLVLDVRTVLERAGFPSLSGMDVVELQQALFAFIYQRRDAAAFEVAPVLEDWLRGQIEKARS